MTQGLFSTSTPRTLRAAIAAAFIAATVAAPALAQERSVAPSAAGTYEPQVGQAGKDVVWVPTPQTLVDKMLDIAKVTPQDRLLDLGSGDGRTVITAAKRGLNATGIEYNPEMADFARRNVQQAGVGNRANIITGDLFEYDLSKADVITMFLLPSINDKLRPHLLELKPGTRVVSNSFRMGDWEPDQTETVTQDCKSYCTALLWIVPAKVEGTWRLGNQPLTLTQHYQTFTGKLGSNEITDGRLNGSHISFTAGGQRYEGTVNGNSIQGGNWTATKG